MGPHPVFLAIRQQMVKKHLPRNSIEKTQGETGRG